MYKHKKYAWLTMHMQNNWTKVHGHNYTKFVYYSTGIILLMCIFKYCTWRLETSKFGCAHTYSNNGRVETSKFGSFGEFECIATYISKMEY